VSPRALRTLVREAHQFFDDSGNNAIAFKTSQTTGFASESSSGSFVFTQNPAQAPTVAANVNAAITNGEHMCYHVSKRRADML
jgi:hypothetical protein